MSINDNLNNDIIFFKNEILSDMKNIQSKLADKISQIDEIISQHNSKLDNKINEIYSKFDLLSKEIQEKKNEDNIESIIQPIKQKLEENISKLEIQLNLLERDYGNSCFKYDKIISNNLNVPGLIGNACPYDTLRPFLEYVNIKILELIKTKEKQNFDFKKYKEKLDSIISNNKTQFDQAQNRINEFCKNGFKQCENNCNEKLDVFEKRIEALRIENGKFSYELKKRSEELKVEWEKLDNYEKDLNIRYDEEMEKYKKIVQNITKKVDKSKEEFNLIKIRFTELSEFIKDVRFRKNINNTFQERKQYKDMSNKIDFNKKQKISTEIKDENEKEDLERNIFEPIDYYSHFEMAHSVKEEEEYLKEEQNKNSENNNVIQNDNNNENNKVIIINKVNKENFNNIVNNEKNNNITTNKITNIHYIYMKYFLG